MLALVFALLLGPLNAAEFTVPPLTGPVVDQGAILSANGREAIAQFLLQHRNAGGAQIQVVTLKSLEGLPIEEAAIKIADQWKIGRSKEDRGVILVIALADHKLRIEVGKGLEGDLTDAASSRIVHEVMIPLLKAGDADRAVVDGVLAIAHATDPSLDHAGSQPAGPQRTQRRGAGGWPHLLIWILLFFFFIGPGRRFGWLFLLSGMGGGRGSGWGGGSSGGGGWSGGGGGFNGGGSSGSW